MRLNLFVLFVVLSIATDAPAQQPAVLAEKGRALHPVIVGKDASERVQKAARTLADYLGRMSGAKFDVTAGDGKTGIAVGLPQHFNLRTAQGLWNDQEPTQQEDYLLRSQAQGLWLIGASDLAVEHAVWDTLYRLGHRQFFPGPTWEVVPKLDKLALAVDSHEHPAYHMRRIWYGYGAAKWSAAHYQDWCAKNRALAGIAIQSGHAYGGIENRNKAEFAKHPEYKGLVNGERKGNQFCISNPGLRELVVNDTLAQLAKNPAQQCISVEPNDGGGWCECALCKKMGSVTDRAVTLANQVAAAVDQKFPGKFVGMYAYSQHSPPPNIDVHPRVVINVATAFITGGFTVDQLMEGWQKKKATIGVREYYSVHTWDRDLPGRARGGDLAYLAKTIPHFHALGARFLSAESSDNWGPNGLGYYLAARMLWDVREAKKMDDLRTDFLERAFGPARKPMDEFYRLIDKSSKPLLTDDLLGRMYRKLQEAWQLTDDPAIRARLHDLILYTRYVEHWLDFAAASGPEHQQAFEAMVKHGYRMRKTLMIHVLGLGRDVKARDKSLVMPKEASPYIAAPKNPWMSDEPFTAAELEKLVADGIARRKLFDFQPVAFSTNLVPAPKLAAFAGKVPVKKGEPLGITARGLRTYFTWLEDKGGTVQLKAKAGLIYGNRGPAQVELFPLAEPEGKAVAEAAVAPDKEEKDIALKTSFGGLHRLEISDKAAGTYVNWPADVAMTIPSSPEVPASFTGRWTLFFYVPRGTKMIGGYASGPGVLIDGAGKTVHKFADRPGYFSIPVASGQDGTVWRFGNTAGQRLLMTVPPYLARSPRELLLPAEVVERDGLGK